MAKKKKKDAPKSNSLKDLVESVNEFLTKNKRDMGVCPPTLANGETWVYALPRWLTSSTWEGSIHGSLPVTPSSTTS
jgi:hypothetical protein